MAVKDEIEYRTLSLVAPKITNEKETSYEVFGYATTFEPYVLLESEGIKIYEQIDKNAFRNTDMSNVIMQYNHEGRVLARQSNGSLELTVDDYGLRVRADLSGSSAARSLYEDIKVGLVDKMSFSFIVGVQTYDKTTRTRYIKSIKKVLEVGAVAIPANDKAVIGARNYISSEIQKRHNELLERKRKKLRIKHALIKEGIL